jgi:hypothetical protein
MLPILMEALNLIGKQNQQAESEKAAKISAALGKMQQMPQQQPQQAAGNPIGSLLGGVLGGVLGGGGGGGKDNKINPATGTNPTSGTPATPMTFGTQKSLDDLGFDGKLGDEDSDDSLLGGY